MSRTRVNERSTTFVGTKQRSSPAFGGSSSDTNTFVCQRKKLCVDTISPPPHVDPNPLSITNKVEGVLRASGSVTHRFSSFVVNKEIYHGYPIDKLQPFYGTEHLIPMGSYVATAVERASPNRSETDIGEVIVGLLELNKLIRRLRNAGTNLLNLGNVSARNAGSLYLTNEFGIQPMIDDVKTLISLQRSSANSMRKFNKAEKGESIRGVLSEGEIKNRVNRWLTTTYSVHHIALENRYKYRVWYSVRFRPNGTKPPSKLMNYAQAVNLDAPLGTVWNLIPFSFLIDYFADLSSFLAASYSSHTIKDVCIMRHESASMQILNRGKTTEFGLQKVDSDSLKFSVTSNLEESKQRRVFSSVNWVPINFSLNKDQVTNVVALLASRGRI